MKKETVVFLVRHCQGTGNIDGRLYGLTDHLVTEEGRKQLRVLTKLLKDVPFDRIYASPLRRARATGLAAAKCAKAPLTIEEGLIEVDFGELDGQVWLSLADKYPQLMETWRDNPIEVVFPGGESMRGALERMTKAFWKCVNASRGEVIVLASHGSALRTLHSYINGFAPEQLGEVTRLVNTALTCLVVKEDDSIEILFQGKGDQTEKERADEILAGKEDADIALALERIATRN